jgi:beta-lactamase regulating signal transducer with metallopeptidase domain
VISILGIAATAGFALPHVLRLERAAPVTAAVIWASALSLRALTVALAVTWLVLFFPATDAFKALTHWCWHHLPAMDVNGHDVGHVTTLVPALLGVASLISLLVGTARLARALHRLTSTSRRQGPAGSVVVGGREVMLAVAGLRRPAVLVSAGAMLELDDDELDAALAHEHAHIERRHRYVLMYAELCRALAHLLPGTRRASEELAFHLERDADHSALARRADRRALAAALRKAAGPRREARALVMALGGGRVDERLEEILGGPRRTSRATTTIAAMLSSLVVVFALAIPPTVVAGIDVVGHAPAAADCH